MLKVRMFLILGIWIAVLPYLGFPYSWKDLLTTASGLILIGLSFALYRALKTKEKEIFDNFRENIDFEENQSKNERV